MGWFFDAKGSLADKANLKNSVLETLRSVEGRVALNSLSKSKKSLFFKNYDDLVGVTEENVTQFINDNFSEIFK